MKKLFILALFGLMTVGVSAQRATDKLDRGLVAVKASGGIFCSWRITAEEYYDVTYNLYRDGTLVKSGLTTSNYMDPSGSTNSKYTVSAVVRGQEQAQCSAVQAWSANYKEIKMNHGSLTSTYVPNDACCADVDGDGELEILLKFDNVSDAENRYMPNGWNGEYAIVEVYKMNGTKLWWLDFGPNMGDFQNNENNIVAFDWDQDGKAEALMRAADGTKIHAADGKTYTVGDASKNYRSPSGGGGANGFMHDGDEFLVYMNGATGVPYVIQEYPLKRLEAGETDLNKAWGDGYGHRSTKHFFGAPFLDGRKPSIFLARGIYTRHKMIAFDVDPATHKLTERWRWMNNTPGPWYGQGFHNYGIADVDMDGRDEICFGSMVIDDNGKGLSTTGLGHGDAQHHGDFDPYTHGLEIFTCQEDHPGNVYRDGTTGKLYYRLSVGNDDGRSIMGNFSNTIPGAIGTSARQDGVVGGVAHAALTSVSKNDIAQNFRIYWDGDLQEETFNYTNGKNTAGGIYKHNRGLIATLSGSLTNNDTKGTACYQGDLFGDWREEVIMRTADNNIRIYTTDVPTEWRNYSLWHDHQYRNAMVWQMCGYNQPPHVSYFLGELEGITVAPPPLTMTGRTEVSNGGTISHNGEEVITCETNDMTINIANGATPYIYIDNAPSLVSGSAPSEATAASYKIDYKYYTHTLQGGAFAGTTRVVKQGDGILTYPELDMTYSGNTDVWGGTLNLNGSIANSPLWLNRHTTLNTPAKSITVKSLTADYGSATTIGGTNTIGTLVATDFLKLGFGSRLKLDIYSEGLKVDQISTAKLIVETKDWQYGPEYNRPAIEFNCHFANGETTLAEGKYNLGKVGTVEGDVTNIKIEGISKVKASFAIENGNLVLNIEGTRDAAAIEWNATESNVWDVANTENFVTHDPARSAETFVEGDDVYFTDNTQNTTVNIVGEVKPANIYYTATKDYIIGGEGKIAGGTFHNNGMGAITMACNNTYTGGNHLTSGTTVVSTLANTTQAYGNLGGVTTNAANFTIENGAVLQNTANVKNGSAMRMVNNGIIKTNATFDQEAAISGDTLVKSGNGTLNMTGNLTAARTIVQQGTMTYNGSRYAKVVELQGTAAISGDGFISSPIYVAEGAKATTTLTNTYYQAYSGALTGTGQLTINPTNTVQRVSITGNWTNFRGTIVYNHTSIMMPLKNSGMPNATLSTGANTNIGIAASSNSASVTYPIGKLIGSGTLRHKEVDFSSSSGVSGNVTWQIGNSSEELGDFTFAGSIYDAGGSNKSNFEKVGTCTMTVSKAWENSGTVKVSEGRLVVGSGVTLGTGALTVAEEGTLMGVSATSIAAARKNPVTNSSVTINGALRCGTSETATTSSFWNFGAKPLTFGAASTLYVGVNKCSTSASVPGCTHLLAEDANGSITFQDGATVSVYLSSSYDPASSIGTDIEKADSFYVFNFPHATVGDVKFDLPALPNHYYWDTNSFKRGYLHIRYTTEETGIVSIAPDEPVKVEVYNTNGIAVASYATTFSEVRADFSRQSLPKGIYILRIRGEKSVASMMQRK